jgi:hypothetical protein
MIIDGRNFGSSWRNLWVHIIMFVFVQRILIITLMDFFNHYWSQQTPFFTNHGLYLRFDIQGVNNVVNPIVENWVAWLTNIQTQLVSNLEEIRRRYKENVDAHCKDQPNFKVENQV